MSKEKSAALANDLNALMGTRNEEDKKLDDEVMSFSGLPYLSIAYGSSGSVADGIAKPGEFVLGGQTALGPSIELAVVTYRLHAVYSINGAAGTEGDCYHLRSDGPTYEDKDWVNFIKKENCPSNCSLIVGKDLLVYLPEKSFAMFQLTSKTLAQYANAICDAAEGGTIVKITTDKASSNDGKKSWFNLKVTKTPIGVKGINGPDLVRDVELPGVSEPLEYFNSKPKKAEDDEARDR